MTVTETALVGGALAIIPSIVMSIIGYLLKKRWDDTDRSFAEARKDVKEDVGAIRQDIKEHIVQSSAVHEAQWKAINSTAIKVAKIEGRQ